MKLLRHYPKPTRNDRYAHSLPGVIRMQQDLEVSPEHCYVVVPKSKKKKNLVIET